MRVEFGYAEDRLPLIELVPENDEELDILTIYASFPDIHIRWDRHEEVEVGG